MGPAGPNQISVTLADDVLGEGLLAIFALHPYHAFHFAHPEVAVHRLVVRDAVGVGAVEHPGDELRQLQLVLLHHIEVFDDVDGRFRGERPIPSRNATKGQGLMPPVSGLKIPHLGRGNPAIFCPWYSKDAPLWQSLHRSPR